MQKQRLRIIVSLVVAIAAASLCGPPPSAGAAVVRTDKHLYNAGEPIVVQFSNAPGIDSDWICVVPVGAPDSEPGDYQYLPAGAAQGTLTFTPRSAGNYEVRAYYNYRQKGYVVTGRYPFSVSSIAVITGQPPTEAAPSPAPATESGPPPEEPPPIEYSGEPEMVVLPGTDVYAAPGIAVDIYFQQGWWWRPWGGFWYRSRSYDHGWAFYSGIPVWWGRIPHDWRHNYRNHLWGGHAWNPRIVPYRGLDRHWRDGRWRNDHGWAGEPRPAVRGDRPAAKPGDRPIRPSARGERPDRKPGEAPVRPGMRQDRPGERRPAGGPAQPGVRGEGAPGARPGGPERPAVKPGGPADAAGRPAGKGEGARSVRPAGPDRPAVKGEGTSAGPDRPGLRGDDAGGGRPAGGRGGDESPSGDRGGGRHGDGPGRGGRR